jgi:hypothetical protein
MSEIRGFISPYLIEPRFSRRRFLEPVTDGKNTPVPISALIKEKRQNKKVELIFFESAQIGKCYAFAYLNPSLSTVKRTQTKITKKYYTNALPEYWGRLLKIHSPPGEHVYFTFDNGEGTPKTMRSAFKEFAAFREVSCESRLVTHTHSELMETLSTPKRMPSLRNLSYYSLPTDDMRQLREAGLHHEVLNYDMSRTRRSKSRSKSRGGTRRR